MKKLTNEVVISKAKSLGFDLVGFAQAVELTDEIEKLNLWLDKKFHAGMNYMGRNIHKRRNPKEILPEAKSIISLALVYNTPFSHSNDIDFGKISRYAWGKDYHLIIWEKLDQLENELKAIDSNFNSISYVDTGPVMDKVWAVKAGLGWMGKHTNIINREIGSWFFIANIICNYEFEYSEQLPDFCGECTACIDACPTDAIVQPYVVDSNKCISYQTIENKNEIDDELKGKFENWLFGCDICQEVCPWNKKFSITTSLKDFYPRNKELTYSEIMQMDEKTFKEKFSDSPIKRTRLSGLKRNAKFLFE
ncbi:Fe-S protein [Ignavibacterium album JCM 16511]|uniref:Fe-S protein n=1 Tax=Ignavibacterium album (strain DSM 19864 / JCM 16511 / NBRC 101810 / Mat9-16) TaxID=945713 RepID=I0ALW3_IGNAJ|nr:tRNA epoxyqueuosine(34) reductase QueG [Ignavibacterium album]AFH49970.1 Fe-S protein [Ignavibacterium album JCM 16511]